MIFYQLRKPSFWIVIAVDVLLLISAHLLAYTIRFEGQFSPLEVSNIRTVLPLLIPFKVIIFLVFGLYKGMWRYTSLLDVTRILKACFLTTFVVIGCLLIVNRFQGYSRAVFILDGLLTFVFISGVRVTLRLLFSKLQGRAASLLQDPGDRKKLLVIGAGGAAEKIIREVKDYQTLPYEIVGLLDDDPAKIGQSIHGVPVFGSIDDLADIAARLGPLEILIAIPSASSEAMSRIIELCRKSQLTFKTLPGLDEIISDQVSIRSMRDVSYKDLLGRPPVRLEMEKIGQVIENKIVMVTGAGGSIGSELCRQLLRFKPGKLILFDISEYNLYQIEMEILHETGFSDYVPILGKIQDKQLLEDVFARYSPDIVFHAAAYKHVPMIENNPWQAISNNVTGTRNIIEVSVASQVERFILVSTDKAVRPTNVMGASKRMTEKIMQAYCSQEVESSTRFMAVRFGNVLGSSGSVIPLFRRQIELGGPVTVTDPEMTRYFMSIEEAAQLILQAAAMGEGGEIFILEMGTPVKIGQMARDLIKLCGRQPDTEIKIKHIGLRPGEKLHEELITEGEGIVPTDHEKIMVLRGNGSNLQQLAEPLARLKELAARHDAKGIKKTLAEIIPEYTPRETEAVL